MSSPTIQETFYSSNYHLVSSKSIIHELYEGVFKQYTKDDNETELFSKPFKLNLVYLEIGSERKLMEYQLLEGDISEEEIIELIKTL